MGAIMDKIKGKAKQIEGRLTGDKVRSAQGTAEKKKGDLKSVGQRAANSVRANVSRAKGKVRNARARSNARTR